MCDYSLMAVPNRLAHEGEELVVYRFPTGSLGFASARDVKRAATPRACLAKTVWMRLADFFNPSRPEPVCAVCIPPGARLRLEDMPMRLQQEYYVGPVEEVTFTQISALVNSYRDAVRFSNGQNVRLKELREGQRVTVLDLSAVEELDLNWLSDERAAFAHRGQ